MQDAIFLQLVDLVDKSDREINFDWASNELYVIGRLSLSNKFLSLVGKKTDNPNMSTVAYAIGITDIKPTSHPIGMSFDRGRSDVADFDLDFMDSRRDEIKAYVSRKYGHVASIATFTKFGDKSVIRDVSRALMVPLSDVNAVLSMVDDWDEFLTSPLTRSFRNKYPEVEVYAKQLHGRIRGTGMHAAGVVASKVPLSSIAPIETRKSPASDDRITVVAVDKDEAESIGLVKMDFLGLKTLTVIDDALKAIDRRHGVSIDTNEIPLDDTAVFKMLNDGMTKAVFQVDAGPYTNLVKTMEVWSFDELAASNALVRPGAANTIGKEYIARKHGNQSVRYPHKLMEPYLKNTLGCILYQEQVMQACMVLGGMTPSEANKVRKIIGKKKDVSEFDQFKTKFVENASKLIKRDKAEKLWHDFEAHAGYSFNASHAVAYSLLSYWTAWLKFHYPVEYMWAVLNNEGDKDKITEYIIECKKLGIEILLPHVNKSGVRWSIENDSLRMGLSSIKFLSETTAQRFVKRAPFKSFAELEEFVLTKNTGVNTRALDSMRRCGAADFHDKTVTEAEKLASLYDVLSIPTSNTLIPDHWHAKLVKSCDFREGDTAVLHGIVRDIKTGTGWALYDVMDEHGSFKFFGNQKLTLEVGKSYLIVVAEKSLVNAVNLDDINESNSIVKYLDESTEDGYVVAVSSRLTKEGKRMGTVVFDDGELRAATLFASRFTAVAPRIKPGRCYDLNVSVSKKTGGLVLNDVA